MQIVLITLFPPDEDEGDQHLLLVLAISVPVLVLLVTLLILVLLYRCCSLCTNYTSSFTIPKLTSFSIIPP